MSDPEATPLSPESPSPQAQVSSPPPQIPVAGRPLPIRAETQSAGTPGRPEETQGPPGETPADRLLKDEGGEILPPEFGGRALPVTPVPAGAAPREIDVPDATKIEGSATPTPPPETTEQVAWKEALAARINVELNIYHSCFTSVRNMVNTLLSGMVQDSADIGEGQWGPGKRTPLENAEPEIALEVYRQVKAELRAGEPIAKGAPKDALSIIGEGLNDALVALAGRTKK